MVILDLAFEYCIFVITGKYNWSIFVGVWLSGYCEYKGVHYTQGVSWQDGCDLTCVCTDAESGLYRCTEV